MFIQASETGVYVQTVDNSKAVQQIRFASFGSDDAECFEATPEDVREYAGKSSLRGIDFLLLFCR